jgi:hypothetical protein
MPIHGRNVEEKRVHDYIPPTEAGNERALLHKRIALPVFCRVSLFTALCDERQAGKQEGEYGLQGYQAQDVSRR